MTNAEKFTEIFDIYAIEVQAKTESEYYGISVIGFSATEE